VLDWWSKPQLEPGIDYDYDDDDEKDDENEERG
jgi:hypothetical protein